MSGKKKNEPISYEDIATKMGPPASGPAPRVGLCARDDQAVANWRVQKEDDTPGCAVSAVKPTTPYSVMSVDEYNAMLKAQQATPVTLRVKYQPRRQ